MSPPSPPTRLVPETATPSPLTPSPPPFPLPPWWGRLETLWLFIAPLCALLFALSLPLAPNDLWYHVRAGELLASHGAIPTTNAMSLAVPLDKPFYYQSWIAELVMYLTLRFGGLTGLTLLRAFLLTGGVAFIAAATFRKILRLPNSPARLLAARLTAAGSLVGFLIASNNVDLRPQVFSAFLFGVWIFAVGEFRYFTGNQQNGTQQKQWGVFLVALAALWANTHGAFVVSILGLGALALGDLLSRRREAKISLWLLGASALAVIVNPCGFKIYVYVAQLSNNDIGQRFIQEWSSPGFDEWHSILFWLLPLALLTLALVGQRKELLRNIPLSEWIPLALFFIMGARDQRSMIWFAFFAAPFLSALLALKTKPATDTPFETVPRAAQFINATLLVFLMLGAGAFFPGIKNNWPWPREFKQRFAPTPQTVFPGDPSLLLDKTTPVVPAQFLFEHPPRGKLFTDMVCGSYLTWATYPKVKAWCDPRIELFSVPFWEDYLRLSGGPRDVAKELASKGFSDALLDRVSQPGLVRRLRQSPDWHLVSSGGTTVLFRRTTS